MPRCSRRCIGWRAGAFSLHALVAVLSTWPLAAHLGRGLPTGREPAATVPLFNLWSLRWTASTPPWRWHTWWDAPIFSPSPGAYARSELQPVTGLAFAALRAVTSDAAAYGLVVLLALTLNGVAAALLARRLGADRTAAAVAGVLAQLAPFLFQQLGVLQLLMVWPAVLFVERGLAWWQQPRLRTAAGAGAALAVALLTCSYHAALAAMAVAPAALAAGVRHRRRWRQLLPGMVVAGVTFAVIAAPFVIGQAARLGDTTWTAPTIEAGSARPADLGPGGPHWPGLGVLAPAALGLWFRRRSRAVVGLAAIASVAALCSLGLHLRVGGLTPYAWLVDHVDAVARMRSPFRAIALTQALAAVLAGVGAQELIRRRHLAGRATVAGFVALAVFGAQLGSGPLAALPEKDEVWMGWLTTHPGGTVAMMPMPTTRPVEAFEPTTEWMLQALDHGHDLVNGYTGFFPAGDREMRQRMAAFPSCDTVAELQGRGVRYVVAEAGWWTSSRVATAETLGITIILGGPDGWLMELTTDPRELCLIPQRPLPS